MGKCCLLIMLCFLNLRTMINGQVAIAQPYCPFYGPVDMVIAMDYARITEYQFGRNVLPGLRNIVEKFIIARDCVHIGLYGLKNGAESGLRTVLPLNEGTTPQRVNEAIDTSLRYIFSGVDDIPTDRQVVIDAAAEMFAYSNRDEGAYILLISDTNSGLFGIQDLEHKPTFSRGGNIHEVLEVGSIDADMKCNATHSFGSVAYTYVYVAQATAIAPPVTTTSGRR